MPSHPLKLSLPANVLSLDPRTAIAASRNYAIQGLEFPAYTPSLRLPDLSATGRREFRHLLSSHQRTLSSVHVDLGPKGFSPGADLDRLLTNLDRALAIARDLGASVLTLELGPLPEPQRIETPKPKITPDLLGALILPPLSSSPRSEIRNPQSSPPPDPGFVSAVDTALTELGQRADRYSIPIAFHSDLSSHAALARVLRATSCPWFALDLDPAAVLRDDWTLEETLAELGPQVRHVRARDAVKGTDRRTRPAPLGQGDTNWTELLELLDETGYHSWLTVDPTDLPDRPTAARAGIEYLLKA